PATGDPGQDTVSGWTVAWGDGTIVTLTGNPASASRVYAQDGVYTILATAADEDGSYASNALAVTVSRVYTPPVAPGLALSGAATGTEASPYGLNLAITPGPNTDAITGWVINWGDQSSQAVSADITSVTHA